MGRAIAGELDYPTPVTGQLLGAFDQGEDVTLDFALTSTSNPGTWVNVVCTIIPEGQDQSGRYTFTAAAGQVAISNVSAIDSDLQYSATITVTVPAATTNTMGQGSAVWELFWADFGNVSVLGSGEIGVLAPQLSLSGVVTVPAPVVTSMTVLGTQFVVTFQEPVTISVATGWTFTDATSSATPAVTYVSGSGASTVTFSLASTVAFNDICTASYNSASGSVFAVGAGTPPLASFTGQTVTNNTPSGFPAVRGAPTTGDVAGTNSLTLPGLSAGDYLYVAIMCGTTAPGTPAGWTLSGSKADAHGGLYIYTKHAAGGDTFAPTAAGCTGAYNAYAVKNCAVGLDAGPATNPTPNGGKTSPAKTIAFAGTLHGTADVVISAFGLVAATPSIGAPSGGITATAQVTNPTTIALATGYETLSGKQSSVRTATVSGKVTSWYTEATAFQ